MRPALLSSALLLAVVALTSCDRYVATPAPDTAIKIMPSQDGRMIAVAPECPDWRTVANSPLENQPAPQFGCATRRNLAAAVERPEDLIKGRQAGPSNGTTTATGVSRYLAGQTKALINPNAEAPVAAAPAPATP